MQYITEQQIDSIATETGRALAIEPKIAIVIHSDDGALHWEGGINGHFFRIRTETRVEVPQSLATLIAQSNAVRVESEARVRAYRRSGGKKVG